MDAKRINVVRIFDCWNLPWRNNYYTNEATVNTILDDCHNILRTRGYLFLNEVYRKLGFNLTQQGQLAGWIYEKESASSILWTVWRVNDFVNNVGITFEPLENILETLPER